MIMLNAEVLQSYAQKLASRALEEGRAQHTDQYLIANARCIRIVSMDGSPAILKEEPNRYVVVDKLS